MINPHVGDKVTIMPPWDNDPVIISMQHYAKVAQVRADGVVVELDAIIPPHPQLYGPFPENRLAAGWRDRNGRWLAT